MSDAASHSDPRALRLLAGRDPVVLAVDDQEPNLRLVGAVLTGAGIEVVPALSGEQALARAALVPPDLVLLDLRMPEMDGFALLRALREGPKTAHIPTIVLTAAHEREQMVEAFARGAVDYVTKPFVADELLARVRTHLELKLVRDHLQRVAHEREELAAIVAHDLKNPLSAIHFSAQLLLRGSSGPPAPEKLARIILQSTDDALAFIQRYLERRAEGELLRSFRSVPIDLTDLLGRAIHRFTLQAQAKGIMLTAQIEGCIALGDPPAVAQVLDNLLSNAIKFSPPDSEVTLACGRGSPGMTRVTVLDRGPGVSPADQRQLFRRYVRLSAQPTGGEASSGLGLALAKQDITHMRGELWYEDRKDGGAIFAFELTAAPDD